MPELPDVEGFRRLVEADALHQSVHHIALPSPEMVKGLSPDTLRRRLQGHALASVRRYGKHLLIEIRDSGWLVLHFGMSGYPRYVKNGGSTPRYTRMALDLDRGRLAYVVPRKLGSIGFVDNVETLIADHHLGIDALDPALDFETFRRLAQTRGAVKCWLMDQSRIAGIGNIYSDEILFHARLHPARNIHDLDEDELKRLYESLCAVLTAAVAKDGDPKRLPDTWILGHRHTGEPCPACAGKIKRQALCGRSAYFCPACQR